MMILRLIIALSFFGCTTSVPVELTSQLAPVEPRGAQYSYYYLGRFVWYVPLWFLFYFLFYVVGLIIRAVVLHQVSLCVICKMDTTTLHYTIHNTVEFFCVAKFNFHNSQIYMQNFGGHTQRFLPDHRCTKNFDLG